MLEPFGSEIWIVGSSDTVAIAGFRYPVRMAVIRLPSDRLFLWSPIRLTDDLRHEIETLGEVRYIVAPNSLHHLFLPDWAEAFPEARVYAAPRLRRKRKDIAFHDGLRDTPSDEWAGEIDQVLMRGNAITAEVVFFHRKSGTVLFVDLLQQFPADWFTGWRAAVAKLDLMVGSEPAVPRKFRLAFTNRRAAREALERILAWPAEQVLIAHGTPVRSDARAFLRRAFRWLSK